MNARRVDGQRQIPVKRCFGLEDPGEALSRFDGNFNACHRGGAGRAGAAGIDDGPAGDLLPVGQCHAADPVGVPIHGHHLAAQIFDAVLAGRPSHPVENAAAVPIALVLQIDRAEDDVIEIVERVARRDLVRREQFGFGTGGTLHGLVGAQHAGKILVVGKIHVAVILDRQFGNALIAAHMLAKIGHEIGGELRDPDIELGRELLAHAGIRMCRRREFVARIAFDHENRPVEVRISRQKEGRCRSHDGAADDDDVIGTAFRCIRHGSGRHSPAPPCMTDRTSQQAPIVW